MLVEKEIIAPGEYWYTDEASGLPRKLTVTPELTKYWCDEGSKMLSSGLTVPVPFEHDFGAHPMTPKDKLLNNSGWIKEYRLKENKLFGVLDIQDEDVAKKLPRTIRWTSPWINSFTDGQGKKWDNVISHLALTTRPRIVKQAPFGSVAAALSMATPWKKEDDHTKGYCLSRAMRLVVRKKTNKIQPQYPVAFSLVSGAKFASDEDSDDDMPPLDDDGADADHDTGSADEDMGSLMDPMQSSAPSSDVKMEELLCDLLVALGVPMPENVGESEFKRALYEATMSKIKELTSKGMAGGAAGAQQAQANTTSPAGNTNPLVGQVQQEQQPMYMSLEDIAKLPEPLKGLALSLHQEHTRMRAEMDAARKITEGLRDAKLKEAKAIRDARITNLSRFPGLKADLDAMLSLPSMALSMGEGGVIVDPMDSTLRMMEKLSGNIPSLVNIRSAALSEQPHPTDDSELNDKQSDELAERMARMMGCPPEKKAG